MLKISKTFSATTPTLTSRSNKNFLVIGNSISIHGICEYWWSICGMGASRKENDFVHLIANTLSQNYQTNFDIINFIQWEAMHYDRSEALSLLNKFNGKNYDFIIIQLGENINNFDTLESDFKALINYIKNKICDAKIILTGNFFTFKNEIIDKIKIKVCNEIDVHFVDLQDINTADYCVGIGYEVFDENGNKHVVNHKGVAIHPNDKAMKVYAERILQLVNK